MSLPFDFSINYKMLLAVLIGMPVLLSLLRLIALKIGLVDTPNYRKIHVESVPLVGGLALFIMAVFLMFLTSDIGDFGIYLIITTSFVVMIGIFDDLFNLSALWRFVIQIIASLLMIYFTNIQLNTFGFLLLPNWDFSLGIFAVPITVFGVVGVVNAINMADGIDGLAAMTFFLPVFVLVMLAEPDELGLWLLFLLMSVLIFMMFNKSKINKVFLGDNGSLMLGFILAWLLVYYSQGSKDSTAIISPVMALYLVGLPIFDTIFVMLNRFLSGNSPFKPDKSHLHHLFLAVGFDQNKALAVMVLMQILMIGFGLIFAFFKLAEHYQFYFFVFMSILYYWRMKTIWANIKVEYS